jgi:hypothetical protein
MIRYECDKCGRPMAADDRQRFIVKMEIFAAADHLDLDAESPADPGQALAEVLDDLASADPDEIEDQTYRAFRFDVCNPCRKELLKKPLG